jgi:uncharacterized repeat protein (TIGR01451 family)
MVGVVAIAGFALMAGSKPLAQSPTVVSCGSVITAPGAYAVVADEICAADGIVIAASDVELDLGGFTLTGSPGEFFGLQAHRVTNVRITGGAFVAFNIGIWMTEASDVRIADVRSTHHESRGMLFQNVSRSAIVGCTSANNGLDGIELDVESDDNVIQGNTVSFNGLNGIQLRSTIFVQRASDRNQFVGNVVTFNGASGIRVFGGESHLVQGNTVTNNRDGIQFYVPQAARGTIIGNDTGGNQFLGLDVQGPGHLIQENYSVGNGRLDVRDRNLPECVNEWTDNVFVTDSEGDGIGAGCITGIDAADARAALSIQKTGPSTALPGQTIAYDITVRNPGVVPALGATLADLVPPGLVLHTAPPGCTAEVACNLGTLRLNSVTAVRLTFVVPAGYSTTSIVNTATVAAENADPRSASASTAITPLADVAVAVTVPTLNPHIGDDVPVTVTATNVSAATVSTATIHVTLPPVLKLKGIAPAQGTFDQAAAQWTLGPLSPAASAALTLMTEVADAGAPSVLAALETASPGDINPSNNSAQLALSIYDPWRTVADLHVTIDGPAIVVPGGTAQYSVRGVNFGSTYALDETIGVAVPPGTTFRAVSSSFGSVCTAPPVGASGEIRCVWSGQSVVGVGRPRELAVTLGFDGVAEGTAFPVTATIDSQTEDPTRHNNVATALTTVTTGPAADLEVTGAFLPSGLPAEVVDFRRPTLAMRFHVRNVGAVPVTAARLQGAVRTADGRSALAITGAAPSQGTIDPVAGAWDVGTLAPGAVATLDVQATVLWRTRLSLELRRVETAPADGHAANDRALLSMDVLPPDGGGRYVAIGNTDAGPKGEVLVGGGLLETSQVQIFDAAGALELAFLAYDPRFPGSVRLAACDIDRDGRDEIVTAAGRTGGGPHVRIFRRTIDGRVIEVTSWYTIDKHYRGGVYVACADVDGDAVPDIVTGTGDEGPAIVQIWRPALETGTVEEVARGTLSDIAPGFGVRVAACDVTGDGRADIVTAPVGGSPPLVRIFDVASKSVVHAFMAARPGEAVGLQVACGDVIPGGGRELLVGLEVAGSPIVRAYQPDGTLLGEAMAFAPTPGGGVRVAAGEFDGEPSLQEFALASGHGAAPQVQVGSAADGVTILLRLVPFELP